MQSGLACIAQAEKFGIYSVESGKSLEDWDSMSKAIFLEDKFVFWLGWYSHLSGSYWPETKSSSLQPFLCLLVKFCIWGKRCNTLLYKLLRGGDLMKAKDLEHGWMDEWANYWSLWASVSSSVKWEWNAYHLRMGVKCSVGCLWYQCYSPNVS